jgi:branched-chain amino acid transport system ATP-binding protein
VNAALELEDVSFSFGGRRAVDGVELSAAGGEVLGLIGPNGAGKSTLLNLVTGLLTPETGRVRLGGGDITAARPDRRARLGLARTFQRLETFGALTVRENVLVAAEARRRWSRDRTAVAGLVDGLLERVGLAALADRRVRSLSTGSSRLVELARALATRPSVLLLDEPASGLDENETTSLASLLTQLAREGLAVVLVEHDMGLVMQVCHRVAVLDQGRLLALGEPAEIRADPQVRSAYLGQAATA